MKNAKNVVTASDQELADGLELDKIFDEIQENVKRMGEIFDRNMESKLFEFTSVVSLNGFFPVMDEGRVKKQNAHGNSFIHSYEGTKHSPCKNIAKILYKTIDPKLTNDPTKSVEVAKEMEQRGREVVSEMQDLHIEFLMDKILETINGFVAKSNEVQDLKNKESKK